MRLCSGAAGAVCVALTMLPGCAVIPAHDGLAQVRVDHVVARIKCEIAMAVLEKAKIKLPNGRTPYAFLYDWAAKLHFTVIVDDQASLNPGATFIHALRPAGTVAQTFSLGVGAGVTTQAVRQEDYEYLMSFSDLRADDPNKNPFYNYCNLPKGLLLESSLELTALVDAALKPIESNVLYPGNNYGPGALPAVGTNLQPLNAKTQLEELKGRKKEGKNLNNFFTARIFENDDDQQAKDIETRAQSIINNIVKPLYGIATSTGLDAKCLGGITFDQEKAIVSSVNLSGDVIKVYQATDDKKAAAVAVVEADFTGLIDFTNIMMKDYKACALAGRKPGEPKLYDPIDAISETVNFYVTATGSITPTWKLVTITAPLAPTFASATRKDTNTLILSLGRPNLTADGTPKASDAMNNQILASLLSQAIAQRPIP
jgi:hypothetical protein